MHEIIAKHIADLDADLAKDIEKHRRETAFALAAEPTVTLLGQYGEGRISVFGDVVSYCVEIKEKPKLVELFRWLAKRGVHRRRNDKPYHCQHDTTIIFGFKHGEINIYVHAEMRAPNCRRVQVGTQPVYEVICS